MFFNFVRPFLLIAAIFQYYLLILNLRQAIFNNLQAMLKQKKNKKEDYDIIFIRHAESEFNKGTNTYAQQQGLYQLGWYDLIENDKFNKAVTYNPKYMDPHITELGLKQCKRAKHMFDPESVDLILVSPQRRALQTCKQIFGEHKNVIVHPLVTEVFRYSCDISHQMEQKIKDFDKYNFQEMKNWTEEWFLEVLTQQKRKICQQHFEKYNIKDFKEKKNAALELLSKKIISETPQQLRQRVCKLKQLIHNLKQIHKANKVAVISHYYTTQCLLSSQFDQKGSIKYYLDIENGKPYFRKFEDILKVK